MRIKDEGNVGIGVTNKLSKLTVKGNADETNIGGTTSANNTTTIAGSGTSFLSKLGIGDRISLSSAPTTYATVTTIVSDTSLTVSSPLGNGTTQTINAKHTAFRVENYSNNVQMIIGDGGNVGIGCTNPNAAALLQIDSTSKGFLPPRMTTAQRNGISSPPEGLIIYNTSTHKVQFYNGSTWGDL